MIPKFNNSKNLKVGNVVKHIRGNYGVVTEVEYVKLPGETMSTSDGMLFNSADEVEIRWLGKYKDIRASRTSSVYIDFVAENLQIFCIENPLEALILTGEELQKLKETTGIRADGEIIDLVEKIINKQS